MEQRLLIWLVKIHAGPKHSQKTFLRDIKTLTFLIPPSVNKYELAAICQTFWAPSSLNIFTRLVMQPD